MALVIPVAHDFVCPWCWIGYFQAKRLQEEFGVKIEWQGYELYPDELPLPTPSTATPAPTNRPATPSRLALAYAAEGIPAPDIKPPYPIRTHRAHEAVEYAKTLGVQDALVERIYIAYWKHGLDIDEMGVLELLAKGLIPDLADYRQAIEERRFRDAIIGFDDPAYAQGVYNVPTFWIGGERYAEQPYVALATAMRNATEAEPRENFYASLDYPPAPADRPYLFINMVSTIDGKTVTGNPDEHVMDLGSKVDHRAMRRIEASAQAVMIGAGSLRATPGLWYPKELIRIVVSRSGNVDFGSRFFTDVPEQAILVVPQGKTLAAHGGVRTLSFGADDVDLAALLRHLRQELGIERLLVEGGPTLNAQLIAADLADEFFLTLAPKLKLGKDTPTYADGDALPREHVRRCVLVEHHRVGDEMFLRYRRDRSSTD